VPPPAGKAVKGRGRSEKVGRLRQNRKESRKREIIRIGEEGVGTLRMIPLLLLWFTVY